MTNLWLSWTLDETLDTEEGHFNFCLSLNMLLRELQTRGRQHLLRVDIDKIAQRQQLSDWRSGDRPDAWIIQSAVANVTCYWAR